MGDWLSGKRERQLAMANDWIAVFQDTQYGTELYNAQAWGIPDDVVQELTRRIEAAETVLAMAQNELTRTPVATARCRDMFGDLVKHMRFIKDRYFKMPPLAPADFTALGIPLQDTTKTTIRVPTGQAEADVNYPGVHLLLLRLRPVAGTLADDKADHGYRIYYGVLPPGGASVEQALGTKRYLQREPVSGEELPHSKFTGRGKELFDFPPEDSGKAAYFSIRYENEKGEAGPWGPMFHAVIP